MGLDMYLVKKKKYARKEWENMKEIAYWRKANHIHNYFVNEVISLKHRKDEDFEYHGDYELIGKPHLVKLLDKVNYLLDNIILEDGEIMNGMRLDKDTGEFVPNMIQGKRIANPQICEEVLPRADGFFFGDQEYTQWYYDDLVHTKEMLEKILKEHDFKNYYIYYCASW